MPVGSIREVVGAKRLISTRRSGPAVRGEGYRGCSAGL